MHRACPTCPNATPHNRPHPPKPQAHHTSGHPFRHTQTPNCTPNPCTDVPRPLRCTPAPKPCPMAFPAPPGRAPPRSTHPTRPPHAPASATAPCMRVPTTLDAPHPFDASPCSQCALAAPDVPYASPDVSQPLLDVPPTPFHVARCSPAPMMCPQTQTMPHRCVPMCPGPLPHASATIHALWLPFACSRSPCTCPGPQPHAPVPFHGRRSLSTCAGPFSCAPAITHATQPTFTHPGPLSHMAHHAPLCPHAMPNAADWPTQHPFHAAATRQPRSSAPALQPHGSPPTPASGMDWK